MWHVRRTDRPAPSRPRTLTVAAVSLAAVAIVAALAPCALAQAKRYDWREVTGVGRPTPDARPAPDPAAPERGAVPGGEAPGGEAPGGEAPAASSPRAGAGSSAIGPGGADQRALTEAELRRMIEEESRRIDAATPAGGPPADQEFFDEAQRIVARQDERAASAGERGAGAEKGADAGTGAGPGASPHLIDAGHRLWRISETITNRVTYVAVSVAILFFLVSLLMWYTGIFTSGEFANPVVIFNRAAIAFVLLLSTPYIMWATDQLCVGAARTIDISFSSEAGVTSSTQEVFRKIAEGMANHTEDYTYQTLISDWGASGVFTLGWLSATMFYSILRAIWEFLWIGLKIVAPLAAVAFMINGEFGSSVFKAWFKSVLCVSSWPIGWSIIFGMMNAGIEDFSRTQPGTLYQVAFLCYMLALLIMSVPALATAFWSGEGVDKTLGAFGQGVANAAVSGLGALGGAMRGVLPGPLGQMADMAGGLAGTVYGQGAAVAEGALHGRIPDIAGARSAYPGGVDLGAAGGAAVSTAGLWAAVTSAQPANLTDVVANKTGLPGPASATGGAPAAAAGVAAGAPAGHAPSSARPEAASRPHGATSHDATGPGATAHPSVAPGGREAPSSAPAPARSASTGAAGAAAGKAGAVAGGTSAAGEDGARLAALSPAYGATLGALGVAPAGRLGANALDPKGIGLDDAHGDRVHKGDSVAYAPPAGVLPAGHYYQGTVVGFGNPSGHEDAAHRFPIVSAREMDASGRPVSAAPQEIRATDWQHGNPGELVRPQTHAPGAGAAAVPKTEGEGVLVGGAAAGGHGFL